MFKSNAFARRFTAILSLTIGVVLLAACGGTDAATTAPQPTAASGASEFFLNPYKDECEVNGALQLCYIGSPTSTGNFVPYAGVIENFEYEWGHGYTLSGSGDANTFVVEEVVNDVVEQGGVQFQLTITGGGGRIVQKDDTLFEFYGEKDFVCDPNASCDTLDQVINREQPITFKFETPVDPTDPLILLTWDSAAVPAQAGEEPGLLMQNPWKMQSFTVSGNEQQVVLAGTEITAEFALDGSFSSGTVSGNAGCNDYSANVTISGNMITFTDLERGEIQCNDPAGVMQQEQLYLSALTVADDFLVDGERLEINYNSGDSTLNMVVAE